MTMEVRIYYEDTDCGGVVYYSNYLKYFERARTELLRSSGIDVGELAEEGVLFVVAHAEIDYKYPARYDDIINIEATISSVQKASFEVCYRISKSGESRLLTTGRTKMVAVDSSRKPVRLKDNIKTTLDKLQSAVNNG